jgi:hypothetical protein
MDLMKRRNLRKRLSRGMATVETALALPTVFLMIVGLTDFSVAFQEFLAANHAAEVAVRSASLSLGSGCNANLVRTSGQNAAAQALVLAGVLDPTGQALYASSVQVTNLDDPDLCAAGLLEIDLPMTLTLPYLQALIDPVVPDAFSQPVAYDVRAVAQNENRN